MIINFKSIKFNLDIDKDYFIIDRSKESKEYYVECYILGSLLPANLCIIFSYDFTRAQLSYHLLERTKEFFRRNHPEIKPQGFYYKDNNFMKIEDFEETVRKILKIIKEAVQNKKLTPYFRNEDIIIQRKYDGKSLIMTATFNRNDSLLYSKSYKITEKTTEDIAIEKFYTTLNNRYKTVFKLIKNKRIV